MDDEIKQWHKELERERAGTDKIERKSHEMNDRLQEAIERLEKQTSELESSQLKLRESFDELEAKVLEVL